MKKDRLYLAESCVKERLGEELILLNLDTGNYHELNETGAMILEIIESLNPDIDLLIDKLKEEFGMESEELVNQVENFIEELVQREILKK
tara:strand:- start:64 stop:333 length:270 start_codon:yes stop_codon:yes gene_type:complete